MDIVFIKQLQINTVIGVYEWEKNIQQRLLIDLELSTDIRIAAANDDIRQALDYAIIAERIKQFVTAKPIELIETVAEQVANLLLTEFATLSVKVTVCKPDALSDAQTVGVTIIRSATECSETVDIAVVRGNG
ncbi:dihydroneopterin aldolase [Rheinheimera salexigens]|uniref:7,8-dihydroneopterin aldolase n=1 Tax=Rheinheimera salexigens TaxID=1628148 RepID=A0A1E7Q9D6_9GAMM|nr:dihydroneopterin aldolase [Rheinheimera salexigens]OEY70812.1 dihydroneopterin aldolase [Rheinheimera salexigens]